MNKKELGQFFTPQNIVELMLDHIGYYGESILFKKYVIIQQVMGLF